MGELLQIPVTQWALEAAQNARLTLEAGVTFVRDLCGADRGLRDAIDRGYVPGCRLQISVTMICQTGGHGDGVPCGPGAGVVADPRLPRAPSAVVDGPERCVDAVRATLRAGADWIKLATTGGLVSEHDQPLVAELTLEEIGVAVFEAARKGRSTSPRTRTAARVSPTRSRGCSLDRARRLPHRGAGGGDGEGGVLPRADARGHAGLRPLGGGRAR